MKTNLKPGSAEDLLRSVLDDRFRSKQEAAIVLGIPLYRLQTACRKNVGVLTGADFRALSPLMPEETREKLREWLLP